MVPFFLSLSFSHTLSRILLHGQALLLDSDVFKKFLRSDQHEATIMGPDERFT